MIIYQPTGEVLLDLSPQLIRDDSYRLKEIQGQNMVMLYFSLNSFIEIPVGSYIEYKAERYHLPSSQNFKKNHSRNYEYTLELYAEYIKAQDVIFKFEGDLKFSLTATPAEFAQLLIENLNQSESGWSVGSVLDSEPVTVDFNKDSCMTAAVKIKDAFKTEYEFENKVLHIHKIEREPESAIPLSYGYEKGILAGLTRQQYDNSRVINRLYVETSDRNINASEYGSKRLRLPASTQIEYKGIQYITSADGRYIERVGRTGRVIEGALDATKHYPSRTGTVSSVVVVDEDKYLYDVIDSSISEDLDYLQYIIPGETMTLVFQTGLLAGKEFDVNYKHENRKFELVPIKENGEIYPTGSLLPAAGDKYKIFNVSMPQSYNDDASMRVLNDAVAYLYDNELPKFTYRWQLNGIYAKKNWLEIGGYLEPGYFILFSDSDFLTTPVPVRITAVKEYLKRPKSPVIDISNSVPGLSKGAIIDQIPSKDQTIDRKTENVKRYTRRKYEDALEAIQMIQEAVDGFSEAIDPVAVRTMSILAGKEELQIEFVSSKTTPVVVSPTIYFDPVTKRMMCGSTIIRHMTLGITRLSSSHSADEYRYWDINSYQSPVLDEPTKKYYLYLKCSKSTSYPSGTFVLSETPLPFDTDPVWYHFLIFTVGSERENNRPLTRLYGFSELGPGYLITDMISSPSGNTYMNLNANNGEGEFGGIFKFKAGSSGLSNIQEFLQLEDDLIDLELEQQQMVDDISEASQQAAAAAAAAAALNYIKDAVENGDTIIAGGLVLASILMLKGNDNIVRAGMSGLKDDNIFLFADPSNAYAKALAGTAMYILRKDGTSKLGIMRIDTNNVGLYKNGIEILQFKTDLVPSRADLVSDIDQTVTIPSGNDSKSLQFNGNFGNSGSIVTASPLTSFSLHITGSIVLSIVNDQSTPIIDSHVTCSFVLERYDSGAWILDRIVVAEAIMSETVGLTEQSFSVENIINLSVGSYRMRIEYSMNTNSINDICYVSASGSMRAQGAQANKAIVFGENGFIRIKDGNNYSLFSDEAVEHKFAVDKYFKMDENGLEVKGPVNLPGLLAAGGVSSAGVLNYSFGKASGASRSNAGLFTVTHSIGHSFYAVNLTLYNSSAQLTAVVTSKTATSFSIRIVNPSSNALTDSAFDFSTHGSN